MYYLQNRNVNSEECASEKDPLTNARRGLTYIIATDANCSSYTSRNKRICSFFHMKFDGEKIPPHISIKERDV